MIQPKKSKIIQNKYHGKKSHDENHTGHDGLLWENRQISPNAPSRPYRISPFWVRSVLLFGRICCWNSCQRMSHGWTKYMHLLDLFCRLCLVLNLDITKWIRVDITRNQPTSVVMFCSSCLHCTSSLIWITDFELNAMLRSTRSQLIYGAVFLTPKSAPKGITPLQAHETWKKSHLLDMNQDESGDSTPWHPCWSQMTWVKQRPKGSHGPLGAGLTSGGRPWHGAPQRSRRRSVRSHAGMEEVSNGGLLWVSRSRAQSLKG